ncbi:GNAT family N-acetyltransferase [Planococcus sp. 1R117A]|uniref:GNAT family N-acetyltransferase n=1 Tax=Planococcus sp. 1R117A TaxID=3447020 RepID=UPI003EDB9362
MKFREASAHEYIKVYEQGYREWAKGRSLEQYIKDNKKEEEYGRRFIVVDGNEEIIASLILLQFTPYLFGIGSIVVNPAFRSRGFGERIIEECLKQYPHAAFMLYSEIGIAYYARFGFCALPAEHQHASQGVCMIRASKELYDRVINEPIPAYF